MLLDTNIVIYACQPGGEWFAPWTTHLDASMASVTRIEVLGYPGITSGEPVQNGYMIPFFPTNHQSLLTRHFLPSSFQFFSFQLLPQLVRLKMEGGK